MRKIAHALRRYEAASTRAPPSALTEIDVLRKIHFLKDMFEQVEKVRGRCLPGYFQAPYYISRLSSFLTSESTAQVSVGGLPGRVLKRGQG